MFFRKRILGWIPLGGRVDLSLFFVLFYCRYDYTGGGLHNQKSNEKNP